jgi:Integrase zinc binding domain
LIVEEKTAMKMRQNIKKHDDQDLYTFHVLDINKTQISATLLQLNKKFKHNIVQEYSNDSHFSSILKIITKYKDETSHVTTNINMMNDTAETKMIGRSHSLYKLTKNDLLFYEDSIDQHYRLCISRNMLKKIFHLTHDRENHYEVSKIYSRLIADYFASSLLRQVKKYIAYCLKCQLNKTLRHKPHEET